VTAGKGRRSNPSDRRYPEFDGCIAGIAAVATAKGFRWIPTEQRPVVTGKSPQIQEAMLQGDFRDRRWGRIAVANGGVNVAQSPALRKCDRANAERIMEGAMHRSPVILCDIATRQQHLNFRASVKRRRCDYRVALN